MVILQLLLNFLSLTSLLDDIKLIVKHLLNGLELHQFLSNLFGEEFWVHFRLIWIFGVLYSRELFLMLLNKLHH